MANETLGASFSIDVTDLKAGLAQANRMIRESESEFKAAAAGMDDWSKSEDGLQAKIKQLNTTTDIQRKKVDKLNEQYENLIRDGLDPTSKRAVELRTKINNETAALNKNEAELKKQTKALKELKDSSKKAGDATEDMGKKFEGLKKAGAAAAAGVAAIAAAGVAAVGSFLALAESTRETREQMAKLETSFTTAGHSAETAEKTFNELYGVLGDSGKAQETAAFLGTMAKDEAELSEMTRALTGVYAQFGDSLPTEGLAEAMNHTAQLGSVQGNLADALEWSGINVDDFNAQLETMGTEEERQAYIIETLNGLYGEQADKYKELNKDIIAAQEAEAGLTNAMADLGAIAEPIMTTLKVLATDLLKAITPFVELIGNGLKGALEGADGAAEQLAQGLSGIVNVLLDRINNLLPAVIDIILELVPQIAQTILSQLPTILATLIDVVTQIINALSELLPQILTAIMALIPQLIQQLIAAVPQLLEAAITLLMAIVNALPTIITALLDALPGLVQTVIDVLIQSIPIILDAALQLFNAIIEAIPVIIQSLITNLPKIINTIIDGLLDALPQLLEAAITLLMAIVEALPTIIKMLVVELPKITTTITSTLLKRLPDIIKMAVELFMGLLKAIPTICKELIKSMPDIISAIVTGLKDGIKDIVKIGGDIIRGLWQGIKDMAGWIGEKIKGFGESVLGGIKDFFGIHSPSKVMADQVGKNLALGIGEGFEDNIGAVNDEITKAMDFSNANFNVSGGRASGGVTVYQTNNYSQAHSRFELYKSKQATAAAVRLAIGGV